MTELVLHHFPQSPFAEKIRLVLGYKQLPWRSVVVPMVMPKPDVTALTGGYRRTPILQIGADIYCDTALICDVLEQLAPQPTLYPPAQQGLARIVAQWADSLLFPVFSAYNFQPAGASHFYSTMSAAQARVLEADRQAMRGGHPRMNSQDAAAAVKSQLRRLAHMLERQAFLLGDDPCVADFSAYPPIWFSREQVPVVANVIDAVPEVRGWADRMKRIGHHQHIDLSSSDAVAVAAASQPVALPDEVFQDEHGLALGSAVGIRAESFGTEITRGVLMAATRTRYSLRRDDARAGTVHVHFPRMGYVLTP